MLEKGSLIDGKYRILHEIGRGGMSIVYLSLNERANKTWAIKELRKSGPAGYEAVRQGLIAEINILKRLRHPHLPGIADVIDRDDSFLVVMDYVEGVSLAKLLKERGSLPWEDVLEWSRQLCDVLAYLHSRRPPIIYRDMKPDNIQLRPDGDITLLDFGTAREYKFRGKGGSDTSCLGTRGYAAPEQYGGMGETDGRTDIYCLGATMYHLLTGHDPSLPPYELKPIRCVDPSLPAPLEQIIRRCTQQDPALRYQSCRELMYDLENMEKMDAMYRKKQKTKLAVFSFFLFLSLSFGSIAAACSMMAERESQEQYERYLERARFNSTRVLSPGDKSYIAAQELYKQAINLRPLEGRAYLELCELYLNEDAAGSSYAVTGSEENEMSILLEDLKKDRSQYAEIAFYWGSAIFMFERFSGDEGSGQGNPAGSEVFMAAAAESSPVELDRSEAVDDAMRRIAKAMHSIAKNQRMLGKNKGKFSIGAGKEEYTYAQYWDDLKSLLDPDLLKRAAAYEKNTDYMLKLYRTVSNAYYNTYPDFSDTGKKREDFEEVASLLKSNIDALEDNRISGQYIRYDSGARENVVYIRGRIEAIMEKSEVLKDMAGYNNKETGENETEVYETGRER